MDESIALVEFSKHRRRASVETVDYAHIEVALKIWFPHRSRPLRSKGDDAAGSGGRDWYHPATYELRCGAEALAALRHAEAHPGAWWISKPRAGSRGTGVRVDASLAPALAVDEACPRVAQRYVRDVALYRGRKFDVRFLVLVRRLEGDALCGRLWRDFWAGKGCDIPDFKGS